MWDLNPAHQRWKAGSLQETDAHAALMVTPSCKKPSGLTLLLLEISGFTLLHNEKYSFAHDKPVLFFCKSMFPESELFFVGGVEEEVGMVGLCNFVINVMA